MPPDEQRFGQTKLPPLKIPLTQKNLCPSGRGSVIRGSRRVETTQISINRRMTDKTCSAHAIAGYMEMEKGSRTDTRVNMGEPRRHHAKGTRTVPRDRVFYDSTYTEFQNRQM